MGNGVAVGGFFGGENTSIRGSSDADTGAGTVKAAKVIENRNSYESSDRFRTSER